MANINVDKQIKNSSAIIVGGSLSGLMTAIALSHQGIKVTVLEKSKEGSGLGAGLQIHGYSPNQTKIEKKLKQLVSEGESSVQLWSSIESRLRKYALNDPNIDLYYSSRVVSIDQDENSAWAETHSGKLFRADILIGADGHRSMVRKKVAPDHVDAKFAGYVVWMSTFPEDELEKGKRPNANEDQVKIFNNRDGFLFGAVITDSHGSRCISCTWYDNSQTELLYRLGAVQGDFVHHSIHGKEIPHNDIEILANQAKLDWSEPWLSATLHAIQSRNFIGVPIKEYVPEKLTNGRFAIVGDAAHVPSPITTSGFNEALKDAVVLSECASEGLQDFKANTALEKYELLRLEKMQQMVESGQEFSRIFGRY